VLRAISIVVMIASAAAVILARGDDFGRFYNGESLSESILAGPGTSAVQAAFALALLDRFPSNDPRAAPAIVGVMAVAGMTLSMGLLTDLDQFTDQALKAANLLAGSPRSNFDLVAAAAVLALLPSSHRVERETDDLAGDTYSSAV
jgi:hypothetical protein